MPVQEALGQSRKRVALRCLRTEQWIYFIVLPAAAFDPAKLSSSGPLLARAVVAASASAGCLAFAYTLNGVTERLTDVSRRKNPLAGMVAVPNPVWSVAALSAVVALALAASLGAESLVACGLSLTSGTLYSSGPHLKRVPVLGLLLNAGIFMPLLVLGAPLHTEAPVTLLAAVFGVLLCQNQLLHERADLAEDLAAGAFTTGWMLGRRGTQVGVAGLALVGLWACAALGPTFGTRAIGALAILLATASATWPGRSDAEKRRLHRVVCFIGGAALYLSFVVEAAP